MHAAAVVGGQLPPVCGTALAAEGNGGAYATHRHILEHGVVVNLTQQMRQGNADGLVPVLGRMKRGEWADGEAAADAKYLNDN